MNHLWSTQNLIKAGVTDHPGCWWKKSGAFSHQGYKKSLGKNHAGITYQPQLVNAGFLVAINRRSRNFLADTPPPRRLWVQNWPKHKPYRLISAPNPNPCRLFFQWTKLPLEFLLREIRSKPWICSRNFPYCKENMLDSQDLTSFGYFYHPGDSSRDLFGDGEFTWPFWKGWKRDLQRSGMKFGHGWVITWIWLFPRRCGKFFWQPRKFQRNLRKKNRKFSKPPKIATRTTCNWYLNQGSQALLELLIVNPLPT